MLPCKRADRGCVAFLGQHYFAGNEADFSVVLKLENCIKRWMLRMGMLGVRTQCSSSF